MYDYIPYKSLIINNYAWINVTDIDLCAGLPCLNNGQCYQENNSYRCECFATYSGPNCEFRDGNTPVG